MALTFDRAHQLLKLDVETGILTWRLSASHGGHRVAGERAGYLHASVKQGYRWIGVDGKRYREHLVIWLMLHGEWVPRGIDHVDRNRQNNKPSNLRKATESQQRQNTTKRSDNTSGYRGVSFHKAAEKYVATTWKDGERHYLGLFDNPEEAAAVARAKRAELFGNYAPSYDATGGL